MSRIRSGAVDDPLAGVRLKLERANVHIAHLLKMSEALEREARSAVAKVMDDDLHGRYIVERVPEIPREYPAVLGDAVHNLRAALDHLAHQLVLAQNGTPTRQTQFPILRDATKAADIHPGMPQTIKSVLEGSQPFRRRAVVEIDPLWCLHHLDIADKHRQLLVTVVANTGAGWWGETNVVPHNIGPLQPGDTLYSFALTEPDQSVDVVISFGVTLNEPDARGSASTADAGWFLTHHVTPAVQDTIRLLMPFIPNARL